MTDLKHTIAEDHAHTHGPACGHKAIIHLDHVDYLHNGHVHHEHDGHYDECSPLLMRALHGFLCNMHLRRLHM